jgi:general stress protein 26
MVLVLCSIKNIVAEIEDFKRKKANKHIRDIIERIGFCMFCTKLGYVPFASRPMTTIKVDDECRIWFFSSGGSHKNAQIEHDNRVELYTRI